MTSRARARVAGVVGRPDLEGAEVWLLHHYDRDARWLTRNIITQEEIALRECSLSAPTPIGCCQGLPEELLEMAFVSGHAEAPPFVLCTVARVCSTLRTLVALRYPALLRCATLAATPGVVRHSLRRRLYEHERAGNEYLIAYIARVAMRWPWAIDNTVTPHTRYPLSAFANETRTLGLYMPQIGPVASQFGRTNRSTPTSTGSRPGSTPARFRRPLHTCSLVAAGQTWLSPGTPRSHTRTWSASSCAC
jgi:hypothetical protein